MNEVWAAISDITAWLILSAEEQDAIISEISKLLEEEYAHLLTRSYSNQEALRISTFRHRASGLDFNLIPGGTFLMGLSREEEKQALAISQEITPLINIMRPAHTVRVSPFLLSRLPICDTFARNHLDLTPNVFRPDFGGGGDTTPIYLTRDEVVDLAQKYHFTLPSEAQWEYAYRGNTNTLFYFGDSLPNEITLANKILLSHFDDLDICADAANPFGLIGLCIGEWCEDSYHSNYTHSSCTDLPISTGVPYVIRGGAASLWPWQCGNEWILCISAMRGSSDNLEEGTCAARLTHKIVL